jgi:hypothetical protein
MQISQQRRRTGSPVGQETDLVSQGLRFVSERVANPGRNRNGKHDSEGASKVAGKGDIMAQARFIDKLFGIAA